MASRSPASMSSISRRCCSATCSARLGAGSAGPCRVGELVLIGELVSWLAGELVGWGNGCSARQVRDNSAVVPLWVPHPPVRCLELHERVLVVPRAQPVRPVVAQFVHRIVKRLVGCAVRCGAVRYSAR
jgi:hypothetical protein